MAKKFTHYLGIDFGASKLGLAFAESETKIAVPLKIIKLADFSIEIAKVIADYKIETIVVGWPSAKFATTNQVQIKNFVKKLEAEFGLPVFLEDERMTTQGATRFKTDGQDDAVAAALILQSFIDQKHAGV